MGASTPETGTPGILYPAEEPVAELLHRAGRGDQTAWSRIVERYSGLLWATARCYDLDAVTAADVCQTTWLRLVERLGTLRHPERLGGWLATTARRESLRALRRELRERVGDPPERPAHDADPLQHALAADERRTLWRALGGLPVRCRSLLRMLAAAPPPRYSEISAALEIPIGSIGPTRARCLRRLRTVLTERTGETAGRDDREQPHG